MILARTIFTLAALAALLTAGKNVDAQQAAPAPVATPGLTEEFSRVFVEHETALTSAHAVEDRRYQAGLASLVTRAQRGGDTDTVSVAQQTLTTLTTRPAPLPAESLTAMAPYTGGWDCHTPWGYWYSLVLRADGTFDRFGRQFGTWTIADNRLTIHGTDYADKYDLPSQSGVLNGTTSDGVHHLTMTRRGLGAAAVVEAGLVGQWEWLIDNSPVPVAFTLSVDGVMKNGNGFAGSWEVSDNELVLTFDTHHEWRETYPLPVGADGTLKGKNNFGQKLIFTRKGRGAPGTSATARPAGGSSDTYFGAKSSAPERAPIATPRP